MTIRIEIPIHKCYKANDVFGLAKVCLEANAQLVDFRSQLVDLDYGPIIQVQIKNNLAGRFKKQMREYGFMVS